MNDGTTLNVLVEVIPLVKTRAGNPIQPSCVAGIAVKMRMRFRIQRSAVLCVHPALTVRLVAGGQYSVYCVIDSDRGILVAESLLKTEAPVTIGENQW